MSLAPDQPGGRVMLAQALALRGEHAAAAEAARGVLAEHADFAPAQMALADALSAQDRVREAAPLRVRLARRFPTSRTQMATLLSEAQTLVRRGECAPRAMRSDFPGLFSVVICSIRPERLARARASLARAFGATPWELIAIDDARSLCEGYNRGLARANGEHVIFCHDDIEVLSEHLGTVLAEGLARADVIGVAGSPELLGPTWFWAPPPARHGWIVHVVDDRPKVDVFSVADPRDVEMKLLDGVFLACRRDTARRLGFDERAFDAFHFYDLDFTLRAHRAGLRVRVVHDVWLAHWSGGVYNDDWRRGADRFVHKFALPPGPPCAPISGGAVQADDLDQSREILRWLREWTR